MGDTIDAYEANRILVAAERTERRREAERDFPSARMQCQKHGMNMVRHTESHYTILGPPSNHFMMNLWPGNCRIKFIKKSPTIGFVEIESPWTLMGVVRKVIELVDHESQSDG